MESFGDVIYRKLKPYDGAEDARLVQEHNVGALSTQEHQVVERVRMRKKHWIPESGHGGGQASCMHIGIAPGGELVGQTLQIFEIGWFRD